MGSWTVTKRGDKQGFDRVTFTPDRLLLHYGANTVFRCKYALDATTTPKSIDIHGAENGTGANPVDPYRCIYKLDGVDLELAVGTPERRPTSFAEAAKEGQHVVLKREPAPKDEQARPQETSQGGQERRGRVRGQQSCPRADPGERLPSRGHTGATADAPAAEGARGRAGRGRGRADIHTALLLAGAEAGKPVQFQPKHMAPSGTRIKISLEYRDADGATVRVPAQRWIRHIPSKKDLAHDWVFAGSGFTVDRADPAVLHYRANDGDVICVANFEAALLDLPIMSSNDNADHIFEAHTERIPPIGAAVLVILDPVARPK